MPPKTPSGPNAFGQLLREHREMRRWSQATLAEDAEVSTRHLSYLETGKAAPSREMVLLLASALDLPMRERNALLGAAGFTPAYRELSLDGPELKDVRHAIELLLAQHEPYPAIVVDPLWNLISMNRGAQFLFGGLVGDDAEMAALMRNAFRLIFHPKGARRYVENWEEVASYGLDLLRRETRVPRDGARELLEEIEVYAGELAKRPLMMLETPLLQLRLRKDDLALRFFTTVTTLGTPHDVTTQEVRIESYFPADEFTRTWMQGAKV